MFFAAPIARVWQLSRVCRAASRTAIAVTVSAAAVLAGDRPLSAQAPTPPSRATTVRLTDAGGRAIALPAPARRIVSLIPSVTETLVALGAGDQVVGRTRYDVAPEVVAKPSVGGTLDPSIEAIVALHPDLVLAWEDDQRQHVRARLLPLGVPVFSLRTEDTTDAFRNIATLGRLAGRDSAAGALSAKLHRELAEVRRSVAGRAPPSVFFVVYNDPPMTAGPSTFIAQLIGIAGGRAAFSDARQLWPTVPIEEIVRRQPDVIIVPTGEFRTNTIERFRAMPGWRELRAVRKGRVVEVPADLVNRPGPRLGEAARALRAALHPEAAAASRHGAALP